MLSTVLASRRSWPTRSNRRRRNSGSVLVATVTVDLLLPTAPYLVEHLQRKPHEMKDVGDHDRATQRVRGGLEPREQIAGHDPRVAGVFGQQTRRRRPTRPWMTATTARCRGRRAR